MNSQHRSVNLLRFALVSHFNFDSFVDGDNVGKHSVSGHKAVDSIAATQLLHSDPIALCSFAIVQNDHKT